MLTEVFPEMAREFDATLERGEDGFCAKSAFLDSIGRGMSDAKSGNAYSTKEVRAALSARKGMRRESSTGGEQK
jgi:hypothetical protein